VWGRGEVLVGKPEGRKQLEDPGVDERIILKWITEKWDGGVDWYFWLRVESRDGLL
jgi:hypothetical protein